VTSTIPARRRPDSCLSDLALERLLVDEPQPPTARAAARAHLASCERCSQRSDALAAAPAQSPDPEWWARPEPRGARRGVDLRWRVRARLGAGALTLAAAAALVFTLRAKPVTSTAKTGTAIDDAQIKGDGFLLELVARRADGRVEPVFEGSVLHPNDAVRFVVTAPEAGQLTVVGVDSAGQVSIYYPAATTPKGGPLALPGSVVLDDALGTERFVALLCRAALDVALDEATLKRAALSGAGAMARSLPGSCRQTSLTIKKAPSP
jgi:hypothetical protein